MENLQITKVLTNNGVAIAYELSNGHQIPLEEAIEMANKGLIINPTPTISRDNLADPLNLTYVPHENINKPSD